MPFQKSGQALDKNSSMTLKKKFTIYCAFTLDQTVTPRRAVFLAKTSQSSLIQNHT